MTSHLLVTRLRELANAVSDGPRAVEREFNMRVPADPDRDADLVLSAAAGEIEMLYAQLAEAVALLVDVRLHEDGDLSAIHSAAEWVQSRDKLLKAISGEENE